MLCSQYEIWDIADLRFIFTKNIADLRDMISWCRPQKKADDQVTCCLPVQSIHKYITLLYIYMYIDYITLHYITLQYNMYVRTYIDTYIPTYHLHTYIQAFTPYIPTHLRTYIAT